MGGFVFVFVHTSLFIIVHSFIHLLGSNPHTMCFCFRFQHFTYLLLSSSLLFSLLLSEARSTVVGVLFPRIKYVIAEISCNNIVNVVRNEAFQELCTLLKADSTLHVCQRQTLIILLHLFCVHSSHSSIKYIRIRLPAASFVHTRPTCSLFLFSLNSTEICFIYRSL